MQNNPSWERLAQPLKLNGKAPHRQVDDVYYERRAGDFNAKDLSVIGNVAVHGKTRLYDELVTTSVIAQNIVVEAVRSPFQMSQLPSQSDIGSSGDAPSNMRRFAPFIAHDPHGDARAAAAHLMRGLCIQPAWRIDGHRPRRRSPA